MATISADRSRPGYFATYSSAETGCEALLTALISRLDARINGSVLATLDERGKARVSYSEKDRSAPDSFWRGVAGPLEEFLTRLPALVWR